MNSDPNHPPKPASGMRSYQLKIAGTLEEDFIATFCPPGTTLQRAGDATLLTGILTDQSGILGLARQLHNLGCTILTLSC